MYLFVKDIDFTSFYYISIEFWNCLDSVVFLVLDYIAIHGFMKTNATTKREKILHLCLDHKSMMGLYPSTLIIPFLGLG